MENMKCPEIVSVWVLNDCFILLNNPSGSV